MAIFIQIGLLLLLLWGCSSQTTPAPATKKTQTSQTKSASQEMAEFKNGAKKGSVPSMVLPPIYEDISLFDEKRITFAAQGAKFSNVMYQIAKESGLNLILDKDVNPDTPITLSIKDANLKDALGIVMDISGCYYKLKGNILYVKGFEQKNFSIPYVHSKTSFGSDLGGDTLGSAGGGGSSGGGGSLKGDFSLKFSNSEESNDFYEQFEKNVASMVSPEGRYTLNRFSGTLNVHDRKKNIDAIEEVIGKIKKETSRQVLIEAKILEVVLNDNHSLGVNWDVVANSVLRSGDQLNIQQALGLGGGVAGTMSYTSKNFSAVIDALDESGEVDTLSNPSINVLSGQSAIISSGKLVPFWEKEVQTTSDNSASNTEVTYNRRDVLDGVTMGVTPTVMEDGRIMLNIIPITSSIEEVVDYKDQNGNSVATAPILNIKEAGTVIYAHDNNLVLIGGLINNSVSKSQQKVPLLGDLPFMGGFFTKTVNTDEKRELVILIRLKIVQ